VNKMALKPRSKSLTPPGEAVAKSCVSFKGRRAAPRRDFLIKGMPSESVLKENDLAPASVVAIAGFANNAGGFYRGSNSRSRC